MSRESASGLELVGADFARPGAAGDGSSARVRVAAAGDIHWRAQDGDRLREGFAALAGRVDLVLLAGDLTTHGEPEQASALAGGAREAGCPVIAVLGNHDYHVGHAGELTQALRDGGVTVLQRGWTTLELAGVEVGVVGTKGFVGGFSGSHVPDFGEPLLRAIYADTSAEVQALDDGLRAIELCPARLVLLHYAPSETTIVGEPPGIWNMLGSDRLSAPIREHEPSLVVHGHAHAGTFEGAIGAVPVRNVSRPVLGRDFWIFECGAGQLERPQIH